MEFWSPHFPYMLFLLALIEFPSILFMSIMLASYPDVFLTISCFGILLTIFGPGCVYGLVSLSKCHCWHLEYVCLLWSSWLWPWRYPRIGQTEFIKCFIKFVFKITYKFQTPNSVVQVLDNAVLVNLVFLLRSSYQCIVSKWVKPFSN